MKPFPAERMRAYPISARVNSARGGVFSWGPSVWTGGALQRVGLRLHLGHNLIELGGNGVIGARMPRSKRPELGGCSA